ncbi:MAG: hypothetical protein IGS54_06205 [Elainella sp. C42_A2020_010]|nr:hypothetical protein [Elainella sp. C42_A2020_010]RNJ68772.1 MAG: hypothetical protein EDM05_13980 [Leptolyngbya sp. IPPAS B-1204]
MRHPALTRLTLSGSPNRPLLKLRIRVEQAATAEGQALLQFLAPLVQVILKSAFLEPKSLQQQNRMERY